MASSLPQDIKDARKAAEDLTPIEDDIKRLVSRRHAAEFRKEPVGDMRTLGPSVVNLQVWEMSSDGFTFGTMVDYAEDYADFRESELGEPLLYLDDELSDQIFDLWAEHVFSNLTV